MILLRDSGVKLPEDSPCAKALAENAGDSRDAGPPARACRWRRWSRRPAARPASWCASRWRTRTPSVRAAGATAFAKPGAGRPALYRLQPLLQDSSPDVRAAAAGGLVRACGDLALPFVQPMFKERDDRALVAMAPELGHLKSPESADMLAKMMSRPGGELRLAVTRGLVERKDDPGRRCARRRSRASATTLTRPRSCAAWSTPTRSPDELLKQPRDPLLGPMGFKALLRAKRHAEAIDWLVANFDRLSPDTAVDLLAALAREPARRPGPTAPAKAGRLAAS